VIEKLYNVIYVDTDRKHNINIILGSVKSSLKISLRDVYIKCEVVNYKVYSRDNIDYEYLNSLISRGSICTSTLLSKKIISKLIKIPQDCIRKIAIDSRIFPYISSSYLEICRKIGIIFILNDYIVSRFIRVVSCSNVHILHYLFMLLGFNYNSNFATLGRICFEKLRKITHTFLKS